MEMNKILQNPAYFGQIIPDDILENVLFRFIYNIPDNEKEDPIRICFHIEQAYWFYADFYCNDPVDNVFLHPPKKIGFREFARQSFYKCSFLHKWCPSVDQIIDEFRRYKSSVPTCGVIMLDPTLNYVLLVQGYYASKNSWGFPKGKVNEGEIPLQCAIREALEEVGFDSTDYISNKIGPLQSVINYTAVRLYLATDVPMDFLFKPHIRNEIRKISWFSIWDLPANKQDEEAAERLGLNPNNLYTVLPFVENIRSFIRYELANRSKLKMTVLKQEENSSAFEPFKQKLVEDPSISFLFNTPSSKSQWMQRVSLPGSSEGNISVEKLFKPVEISSPNRHISFTGQSFIKEFEVNMRNSHSKTTNQRNPTLGIIGSEKQNRAEIKQPKPLGSLHSGQMIVNVYEAPLESTSIVSTTNNGGNDEPQCSGTEIVDMLRSSLTSLSRKESFIPWENKPVADNIRIRDFSSKEGDHINIIDLLMSRAEDPSQDENNSGIFLHQSEQPTHSNNELMNIQQQHNDELDLWRENYCNAQESPFIESTPVTQKKTTRSIRIEPCDAWKKFTFTFQISANLMDSIPYTDL